jgi:hypothetical protein
MFERFGDINIIANLPILTNPRGTVGIPAVQKQVVLSNFANTYGVYDSIAVYSLQGGLVLRSEQPTEANIADSPEFQKAIQTGERVISQPQVSAITKQPVVYFYGVVRNFDTKQPAFVVRTRMPIIYLENILKASSRTMGSSMSFMRVTVRRKHRAAYVPVSRRACTCTCRSSCICAFFVFSKHKCSRMHACVRNACARCTQPSIRTHERAKLLEVDGAVAVLVNVCARARVEGGGVVSARPRGIRDAHGS